MKRSYIWVILFVIMAAQIIGTFSTEGIIVPLAPLFPRGTLTQGTNWQPYPRPMGIGRLFPCAEKNGRSVPEPGGFFYR